MALQNKVGLYSAPAVAGTRASTNQSIYTATGYLAEGEVKTGSFVFHHSEGKASATKEGATSVLGLVERVIAYYNPDVRSDATSDIADGEALTIAVKGDYHIVAPAQATYKQAVFINPKTGDVSLAAAGGTVADSIDTGWRVEHDGNEGDIIIISNWE